MKVTIHYSDRDTTTTHRAVKDIEVNIHETRTVWMSHYDGETTHVIDDSIEQVETETEEYTHTLTQ